MSIIITALCETLLKTVYCIYNILYKPGFLYKYLLYDINSKILKMKIKLWQTQCFHLNIVIYMNKSFNQTLHLLNFENVCIFWGFISYTKTENWIHIFLYNTIHSKIQNTVSDNFQHTQYFKRLFASKLQRSWSNYLLKIIFRMAMLTHITRIPYKDKFLEIPKIPSILFIINAENIKNSE